MLVSGGLVLRMGKGYHVRLVFSTSTWIVRFWNFLLRVQVCFRSFQPVLMAEPEMAKRKQSSSKALPSPLESQARSRLMYRKIVSPRLWFPSFSRTKACGARAYHATLSHLALGQNPISSHRSQ